jgi:hypothetical protein
MYFFHLHLPDDLWHRMRSRTISYVYHFRFLIRRITGKRGTSVLWDRFSVSLPSSRLGRGIRIVSASVDPQAGASEAPLQACQVFGPILNGVRRTRVVAESLLWVSNRVPAFAGIVLPQVVAATWRMDQNSSHPESRPGIISVLLDRPSTLAGRDHMTNFIWSVERECEGDLQCDTLVIELESRVNAWDITSETPREDGAVSASDRVMSPWGGHQTSLCSIALSRVSGAVMRFGAVPSRHLFSGAGILPSIGSGECDEAREEDSTFRKAPPRDWATTHSAPATTAPEGLGGKYGPSIPGRSTALSGNGRVMTKMQATFFCPDSVNYPARHPSAKSESTWGRMAAEVASVLVKRSLRASITTDSRHPSASSQ